MANSFLHIKHVVVYKIIPPNKHGLERVVLANLVIEKNPAFVSVYNYVLPVFNKVHNTGYI